MYGEQVYCISDKAGEHGCCDCDVALTLGKREDHGRQGGYAAPDAHWQSCSIGEFNFEAVSERSLGLRLQCEEFWGRCQKVSKQCVHIMVQNRSVNIA